MPSGPLGNRPLASPQIRRCRAGHPRTGNPLCTLGQAAWKTRKANQRPTEPMVYRHAGKSAPNPDTRQWTRVLIAPPPQSIGHQNLLLQTPPAMAKRQCRKHEWPHPAVHSPWHRPRQLYKRRSATPRKPPQQHSQKMPCLQNPGRAIPISPQTVALRM